MDELEIIQVECYSVSGYKGEETPRAFVYEGKRYEILEILDRWYEGGTTSKMPQLDYYKVRADDTRVYLLRYNKLFDKWALVSVYS